MKIVGELKPLKAGTSNMLWPMKNQKESIIPWKSLMINEDDNVSLPVRIPLIHLAELQDPTLLRGKRWRSG